jgi:hypothetical protein
MCRWLAPIMASRYAKGFAVAIVGCTIAAIWLFSGVGVGEAAQFIAFEALYVILPGCLLYLVLISESGGWSRVLVIGWPLGYAIEVGAFALTAALDARTVFTFLPVISIVLIAMLFARARACRRRCSRDRSFVLEPPRLPQTPYPTTLELVLVGVVISVVLVVFALTLFLFRPLPGHFQSVVYPVENLFAISIAAEARHHWPITMPWAAGLPLRYYVAVFIHGAAINQVTGVSLVTIYLRLFPTTATLLLALQLWSLGRSMARSTLAGPLAIVLFFLVGAATLTPSAWPFEGGALYDFWSSTTLTFGALFFLGLLSLMQHWLSYHPWSASHAGVRAAASPWPSNRGMLVLLAILVLGCSAAKTFAALDFFGALGIFWLWSVITGKANRQLSYLLAATTVGIAIIYLALLAGGAASAIGIQPINMAFVQTVSTQATDYAQAVGVHSVLRVALLVGAVIVIAACLSAPVLGAVWLLVRGRPLSAFELFCLAVVSVGWLGYYLTFGHSFYAEAYFRTFGYFALLLLTARGLIDFWEETPVGTRRAVTVTCGIVLVVGLGIAEGLRVVPFTNHAEHVWDIAAYGFIAVVVVLAVRRLRRYYAPVTSSRSVGALACCIPVVGVLGLVGRLSATAPEAKAVLVGKSEVWLPSPTVYGMTLALYEGLVWVRTHTRTCDVLAVNNYYAGPSVRHSPAFLYYSALAERRVFLEGWANTPSAVDADPFPRRLALNNSAVLRGDPVALRDLAREGVSYVLLNKTNGGSARESSGVSRLVFSNSAVDVYHLLAEATASHARLGCRENA